jgi:hypothetical protein
MAAPAGSGGGGGGGGGGNAPLALAPARSAPPTAFPLSKCATCFDLFEAAAGVTCAAPVAPHFLCNECVNTYVPTCLRPEKIRKLRCAVPCPGLVKGPGGEDVPCASPRWQFAALQTHLAKETVLAYVDAMKTFTSTLLDAEAAEVERARVLAARAAEVKAATARNDRAAMISALRTQIVSAHLPLRCPRCSNVFDDAYDGCDALTCDRCGAGFCGLCLQDCGDDAHKHVASANHANAPHALRVHAPTEAKRHLHAALRRDAVAAAVAELSVANDVKRDLIEAMRKDLTDLRVDVAEVLAVARIPLAQPDGSGWGGGGGGGGDGAHPVPRPPPAAAPGGAFGSKAMRHAATDCLHDCPPWARGACGFRHAAPSRVFCTDWVVLNDFNGPYCPRGPGCPWAHPHHKAVFLTDCPACAPGARGGRPFPCAYTGNGLPSTLRHTPGAKPLAARGLCADFAPLAGKKCPRAHACPHVHVMNPQQPRDGGY